MEKDNTQEPFVDVALLQSKTIDFLRFPLVVMVVFIHMSPDVVNLPDADFNIWTLHGIYNIVAIFGSHALSAIAVPTFFFISGFLFFLNIHDWDAVKYRDKLKNRIRTLLIPYILWNLAPYVFSILAAVILACIGEKTMNDILDVVGSFSWHMFYDYYFWNEDIYNWIGEPFRVTAPYDLPLWFVRDLIIITICAPIIYFAIKRFKLLFIGILFLAYISRIWPSIPGFNISAWFCFPFGAYFAIHKINIVQWVRKDAKVFMLLFVTLLALISVYDGNSTIIGQNVMPWFICVGIPSIIYLASLCLTKFKLQPNKILVSSCFFIYALHGLIIQYLGSPVRSISILTYSFFTGINEGHVYLNLLLTYLLAPLITIAFCVIVLLVVRRLFPRIAMLLTGNR